MTVSTAPGIGKVDLIECLFVIHHGPKKEKMLARLLNKDGTLNIKPKGISIFKQKDFHYSIVTTNWLNFFLVITGFFCVINVLFTIVYLLLGSNEIAGIMHDDKVGYFWEVFFFSAQTITTVGYGRISPVGVAASWVAAIESMMGLILFAFATGLTYSRFSRPKTKIHYSKIMLIGPYQNGLALMVRATSMKFLKLCLPCSGGWTDTSLSS